MPSRFFSYKTKNLVQYLVRDSVYRRTSDLLSLNTDPNYVKLYCEPFPDRLKDFKKAKNPVWKFFYFSKFIRMPLLISNEVETNLQFIEKEERYTFIKEFWEAGFDYTKTKRYHTFKKLIEKGKTIHKKKKFALQSDQDLKEYFSEYEKLLISMNKNGYDVNIDQDDILIWIGPNGELIKCTGGRHRFAASRVTGISNVPLQIKYIHTDWIKSQMKYSNPATDQIRTEDIRIALKKVRDIYNHQDEVD